MSSGGSIEEYRQYERLFESEPFKREVSVSSSSEVCSCAFGPSTLLSKVLAFILSSGDFRMVRLGASNKCIEVKLCFGLKKYGAQLSDTGRPYVLDISDLSLASIAGCFKLGL